MASIYKKNNKIYLSWYDFVLQKRLNKSLDLDYNPKNWKEALIFKKRFETELAKEKEKTKGLMLKRKNINDAFEHFLRNNASKHPKTIADYKRFYRKFSESFDVTKPCALITKINVESWLNKIKKLPLKKNSIFGYYKQLNHFLNFLFEYDYLPMFKINRDVKPKSENVEKIIFSLEDLAVVFGSLSFMRKNDNFKTLLYLLYYTGLRASDLLSIEIQNVDIKNRSLRYYSPKRKVYRLISFHDDLVDLFESARAQKSEGKILNYKNVEALQRAIHRYLMDIQLGGSGYSSRSFRKSFVTTARRHGLDESVVKELVGHSHTSTTDKFYNKIELEQMAAELKKYVKVSTLPYAEVAHRFEQIKKNNVQSQRKLSKEERAFYVKKQKAEVQTEVHFT